jgi:hypothetical protein
VKNRKQPARRAHPEPLAGLLGLARNLPGPWHTSSSNIGMQPVVVRAADAEWRVYVHAYAVRDHLTDPRRVEVTVGVTVSTDRLPPTRAGRARVREWQGGFASRLAAIGYKGVLGRSPDGPFAHFCRELENVAAVPSAIRQLQRIRF